MQQLDGKFTCDREIGSPVKGWHTCGRRATYGVSRASPQGFCHEIHYCEAHHNAGVADMRSVKSLRTTGERILP